MAELCWRLGRPEEGLAALDETDVRSAAGGQRYVEAEALRLRAELLRLQGAPQAEVEDRLRRALEHARGQSARSLELRAAMSLARVLAEHGRRDEARDLLAAVYPGFTEGFQTGDLLEAKQLLEELA